MSKLDDGSNKDERLSMPGKESQDNYLYHAFISYRHVEPDRAWAQWLHGAIETYPVPKAFREKGTPARLKPVFRDEEELPVSSDLSREIDTA
ncbi:MAG: hypothetical protein KJ052_10835, partial [Candidatus Hydrogenedentes bacterium]|nr:hypothetical protein [Candidatus Hydrogenedentota bacterium]